MITIVSAEYLKNFILKLSFNDGTQKEVNLAAHLEGEIFEPLKVEAYFRKFELNSDLGTVCWPNGADFSPEFLHNL